MATAAPLERGKRAGGFHDFPVLLRFHAWVGVRPPHVWQKPINSISAGVCDFLRFFFQNLNEIERCFLEFPFCIAKRNVFENVCAFRTRLLQENDRNPKQNGGADAK